MKKVLIISFVLAVFGISGAYAHGIWVAMRADKIQIVYGDGPLDNRFNDKSLKSVKGYDQNGNKKNVETKSKKAGGAVTLLPEDSVQVITANSESYYSESKSGKWIQKSKLEAPNSKRSMLFKKINVSYINQKVMLKKSQDIVLISKPQAHNLELEIVPQVDPRGLKKGDELKVLVLKNGKPLPDAKIVPDLVGDYSTKVITDKEGYATFKIRNDGLNVVATTSKNPATDSKKADEDSLFSTLAFTLFNKSE